MIKKRKTDPHFVDVVRRELPKVCSTNYKIIKTSQYLKYPFEYAIAKIVTTDIDYEKDNSLDVERRTE